MLGKKFGEKAVSAVWEKMENCIFFDEPGLGLSVRVLDSAARKNLDKCTNSDE